MRILMLVLVLLLILVACGPKEIMEVEPRTSEEDPQSEQTEPEIDPDRRILEVSSACTSNDDCQKYHACTEMRCANKDAVNQKISEIIMEHCKVDPIDYNPANPFTPCECIQGTCQHVE